MISINTRESVEYGDVLQGEKPLIQDCKNRMTKILGFNCEQLIVIIDNVFRTMPETQEKIGKENLKKVSQAFISTLIQLDIDISNTSTHKLIIENALEILIDMKKRGIYKREKPFDLEKIIINHLICNCHKEFQTKNN